MIILMNGQKLFWMQCLERIVWLVSWPALFKMPGNHTYTILLFIQNVSSAIRSSKYAALIGTKLSMWPTKGMSWNLVKLMNARHLKVTLHIFPSTNKLTKKNNNVCVLEERDGAILIDIKIVYACKHLFANPNRQLLFHYISAKKVELALFYRVDWL